MTLPPDPLAALEGGRRPPWSEFRAALDAVGFRPTRGLGQNFLVDPNAARSIALDSGVGPGENVLEVGSGCGFLSIHLAELGVELLAVEIDPRLYEVASRFLAGYRNVRLLQGDVLAGKHELAPFVLRELPSSGAWQLVSNLPYSISAPLLVVLSRLPNPPTRVTVLVQEEVAERILARVGESAWGALSARLGLLYAARGGRRVGAQLFWPRPRVASRVLHLEWSPHESGLTPADLAAFDSLVHGLFQGRRKQVLRALGDLLGNRETARELLAAAGEDLDPRTRPEAISPGILLALSRSPLWRG